MLDLAKIVKFIKHEPSYFLNALLEPQTDDMVTILISVFIHIL